jgi:hypothetical protein
MGCVTPDRITPEKFPTIQATFQVRNTFVTETRSSPTGPTTIQNDALTYRHNLAGAGGIEPPNGGIKIRCLTAWLRPSTDAGRPIAAGN